jgi:predicted dehydrogenase
MALRTQRRQFLQTSLAAGVGYWVAGGVSRAFSKSPNEQIQLAGIGVDGKGKSDLRHASEGAKIYALCDVDQILLSPASGVYEINADRQFSDYREMLDRLGDQIDAVTISTPDHCHAVAAAKAMRMGKAVYCQKPLTHSIYEARQLASIAREMGVATQMGNQWTSTNPMRKAAHQIRAGQLGNVKEVHVWTDRPVWPQGEKRGETKSVPPQLDWEAWIGPAPFRPYADGYHQFKWRGWWDFGTGALGDMACHTCNLPFMALDMRDPTLVEAETSGHNGDSYPTRSKIRFEFPARNGRPAFTMVWYDGSNRPPQEMFEQFKLTTEHDGQKLKPHISGAVFLGDKANMYAAGDYADLGIEIAGDVDELEIEYTKAFAPGGDQGHMNEFLNAVRNPDQPATPNFPDYAGPLTETILLGNLAVAKAREPGTTARVEWDAKRLLARGETALAKIVRREYRDGYVL